MTSTVIIANPVSGHGKSRRSAEALQGALRGLGQSAEIAFTQAPADAETLARGATDAGTQNVVACGGDGTVQQVAAALAGGGSRFAILPAGRCNDFWRALKTPAEPAELAAMLAAGNSRRISLGKIGDRHFCSVAALGFDAAVSRYVADMWLPIKGLASYAWGVLNVLPRFQAPHVTLRGDFGELAGPVFLLAIGNTACYGGGIQIVPDASCDDDELSLCLVRGVNKWRVLTLFPQAIKGNHRTAPEVTMLKTKRLEIESKTPLEIWADGEFVTHTPVTLTAAPNALTVACQ